MLLFLCFLYVIFFPHIAIGRQTEDSDSGSDFFADLLEKAGRAKRFFFLSSYSVNSFASWFTTVVFVALLSLWIPIINYFYFEYHKPDKRYKREVDPSVENIKENENVSRSEYMFRLTFSAIIYVICLAIAIGITFGMTVLQYNLAASLIFSLIISVVNVVVGIIFTFAADFLTTFERHWTHANAKSSYLFKLVIFRELNFFMILFSKYLVYVVLKDKLKFDWHIPKMFWDSTEESMEALLIDMKCGINDTGDQVLIFMVVDLVVSNALELFSPMCIAFVKQYIFKMTSIKSIDYYGDFDIATEYFELIYRQFILYISFPFMPILSFLCTLINGIEILIDRLRLFRFCKVPKPINTDIHKTVSFYLIVTAVLAFFAFPRGTLYTLTGTTYTKYCVNTVFSNSYYK